MAIPERPSPLAGILRGAAPARPLPFADLEGSGDLVALPSSRGGDPKGTRIRELETRVAELEGRLAEQAKSHERSAAAAREDAYQQGLRDGESAGEAAGKAAGRATALAESERALAELRQSVESRLEAVEAALDGVVEEWDARFFELALAVARRVVGEACRAGAGAVENVARLALRQTGAEARLVVRCHPSDLTALERDSELWGTRGGARRIELSPDETVGRGGVVVETAQGQVDARLPRLVEQVEKTLRAAFLAESERARARS